MTADQKLKQLHSFESALCKSCHFAKDFIFIKTAVLKYLMLTTTILNSLEIKNKSDLPDLKYCFDLMKKMSMMDHIIEHSIMVKNVADCICSLLKPLYPELDSKLVQVSALLHDITKTRSFKTGEKHDESGGRLLADLGYNKVGDIIRQHVVLDEYNNFKAPVTEVEIVNYADKRVLHHGVVPLVKRLEYILDKYGKTEEFCRRINKMWKNTEQLEIKLFKDLDVSPGAIADLVEKINSSKGTEKKK